MTQILYLPELSPTQLDSEQELRELNLAISTVAHEWLKGKTDCGLCFEDHRIGQIVIMQMSATEAALVFCHPGEGLNPFIVSMTGARNMPHTIMHTENKDEFYKYKGITEQLCIEYMLEALQQAIHDVTPRPLTFDEYIALGERAYSTRFEQRFKELISQLSS